MSRFLGCLVPVAFVVAAAWSQAQTITTFPFDETASWVDPDSHFSIGAEGDVWFILTEPLRLMRIHEGQLECVYETATYGHWYVDVIVAPDGTMYIDNFQYEFSLEAGVTGTGVIQPSFAWHIILFKGTIDASGRMFCVVGPAISQDPYDYNIYELYRKASYQCRIILSDISSIVPASAEEFWIVNAHSAPHHHPPPSLLRVNLDTGQVEAIYTIAAEATRLFARDSEGRLWMAYDEIAYFDGESFVVFAMRPEDTYGQYLSLSLAAGEAVWAVLCLSTRPDYEWDVVRFSGDQTRVFTAEDGLLPSEMPWPPSIDYDGNVWIMSYDGVSMISNGGWPPMRLMLHRLDTPESISVEAQVINNGPVVGVDVYLALQMNGQLLFWPNWQPAPCPVQVNLRPGHNQTATIISAPRSSIPPGTYTFWGCMTGRNTHKLIGPLDRKFESLTIQID
ncbi:MAG: hypothetical protein JW759_03765 [Candidatus Coatesbacteria bacterium]|nr:hypothetical protein [Candidatus Coatesbacteria bacterium]